jgi:hypothetical protein
VLFDREQKNPTRSGMEIQSLKLKLGRSEPGAHGPALLKKKKKKVPNKLLFFFFFFFCSFPVPVKKKRSSIFLAFLHLPQINHTERATKRDRMAMVSWNSAINSEVFSSFAFSHLFSSIPDLIFYSLSLESRDRSSKFSAERKRETETTTTPSKSSKLRLRPRALAFVAYPLYAPFSTLSLSFSLIYFLLFYIWFIIRFFYLFFIVSYLVYK